MNATLGNPVPSIIWDALLDILEAKTLRLSKEIAETLGVSHIPLMNEINANKVRPYVVELSEDQRDLDMRCDFICQRSDAPLFMQVCAQPVFWGGSQETSKRCPQHLYSSPITTRTLPLLERVLPSEEIEDVLWKSEDGTLYDVTYTARGHYCPIKKQTILFVVDGE